MGDKHDHAHEDHRSHDAHVHGSWEMFAALDDAQLSVTMKGPIVDMLGFERVPETDAERAFVADLKERLTSHQTMLAIDDRAGCTSSTPADIVLPAGFSDASGEDRKVHAHDDHDHAHDEHGDTDIHLNDLEITYIFNCASPSRLRSISVPAFDAFPAIESVEAVFLGDAQQAARRLMRDSQSLKID
ncbi:MAG: DUF2796 domain-containing protein [Pseudomonadota bacterium]